MAELGNSRTLAHGLSGPGAGVGLAAFPNPARINVYPEPPLVFTAIFLLFIVARYMNWGARREIFSATRFEFTLGLLLFALCTYLLMNRPVNFRASMSVLVSMSTLFLCILVQLPFAADPTRASFIFTERVFKFAMLTYFMVVMIRSPRNMKWFLLAFLFACFYVTQESVQGLISGGLYWENQGIMRLHGSVRMYAHPNSLAGLAMGTIPFIVFLFPVLKEKFIRLGLLTLLTTATVCVIYSGSRTAYVALLAFAFFIWVISPRKIRNLLLGCALAVVAIAVLPEQYKERFQSISGVEAEGHSKEARIQILRDSMTILRENPAGVGVASFPMVRMNRFGRSQDTHNLYFEVATNLGWQGLAAFLVYVGFLFQASHKAATSFRNQASQLTTKVIGADLSPPWKREVGKYLRDLNMLVAVCKALAGFIFVRLALGFFGMDLYEVYWWFGGGLAVALLNLSEIIDARTTALLRIIGSNEPETLG